MTMARLALAVLCFVTLTIAQPSYKEYKKAIKDLQKQIDKLSGASKPDLTELDNGYFLAFRGTAEIGQSVYDKYVLPGDDDNSAQYSAMPCGCLTVDGRNHCDRHYKSRIITLWSLMEIDKVRVSIYRRGKEKAYLEFKGRGTTPMDFFSADNLKESTYSDAPVDPNYFSIDGHVQRRFFVNQRYAGNCDKDEGWFVVLDGATKGQDDCGWAQHEDYPVFMYSNGKGASVWNDGGMDVKSGDVFVIAVKFKKN